MSPIGAGLDDRQRRSHVSALEDHAILAYGRRSGAPRGTSDCGDFIDSFAADIRGATRTITDRDRKNASPNVSDHRGVRR